MSVYVDRLPECCGSYEKDGRKVYTTEVVANNVEFLSQKEQQEKDEVPVGFHEVEEDLPF